MRRVICHGLHLQACLLNADSGCMISLYIHCNNSKHNNNNICDTKLRHLVFRAEMERWTDLACTHSIQRVSNIHLSSSSRTSLTRITRQYSSAQVNSPCHMTSTACQIHLPIHEEPDHFLDDPTAAYHHGYPHSPILQARRQRAPSWSSHLGNSWNHGSYTSAFLPGCSVWWWSSKMTQQLGFGPDIFPQIVVTICTFIPCIPTPLPPAFDKVTTLQCTLISTDFKVFLHSYSLLETPLDEHCGVRCLAGILEFINHSDYCLLWKDQLNDIAQHEHPFDFCKAALINIATHSHPGAPILPTPQPRLHLHLISGMGRANAVKPILPPYSPIPPMGSLYPYPFGHTCCGQSYGGSYNGIVFVDTFPQVAI